jgi:hypothetical protein
MNVPHRIPAELLRKKKNPAEFQGEEIWTCNLGMTQLEDHGTNNRKMIEESCLNFTVGLKHYVWTLEDP